MKFALVIAVASAAVPNATSDGRNETIIYRHQPGGLCLDGTSVDCADYTITVLPTGQGSYVNVGRGAVRSVTFKVSAAEMRAYAARLAPFRHLGERWNCSPSVTEGDGIEVIWQQGDRFLASVSLNNGCRFDGKEKMRQALAAAPTLLSGISPLLPH